MDVKLPDGTVIKDVPEGTTKAQLYEKLKANGFDVSGIAPDVRSESYRQGAAQSSPVQRGMTNALSGPFMGFFDEFAGAVSAPFKTLKNGKSLAENYLEGRDFVRGTQDKYKEDFPIGSVLTQAAASAPLAALKAPAVVQKVLPAARGIPEVTGLLGNTARAVGTGFGFGTVQGIGDSTAEDVGGMLTDGLKSGATSAVFSGVASPVLQVGGKVVGNVAQRFSDSSAGNYAKAKIAEAFARDARGNVFKSGNSNPGVQASARMGKLGDSAVVADAGGQNTRQLLDTLATLPGRTKDAVEQTIHSRQAGRAGRMIDSAAENLGTQGQRLSPHLDSWTQQRSAAATPLYERLRSIDLSPTDNLRSLVQAADELGAIGEARAIATANRQHFTIDPTYPQNWNMGQLDGIKQGLDQLIAKQWDAAAGKYTPKGVAYQNLKTQFVNELDRLTTDKRTGQVLYREARNAFAGPSAIIDAAQLGRTAMSKDGAAISELKRGIDSASEMQAFRLGAFEALRTKLGKEGGQTEILKMWKEPATREKLKEIFGDEMRFRRFAADVARESRLKGLESVGRGSQTAPRLAGMEDLGIAADAASMVGNAKAVNPIGVIESAGRLWNRVAVPERTRDQMGQILLSGGQQGRNSLMSLQSIIDEINQRNALLSNATGVGGGLIGSNLAPRIMPPGLLGN